MSGFVSGFVCVFVFVFAFVFDFDLRVVLRSSFLLRLNDHPNATLAYWHPYPMWFNFTFFFSVG